MKTLVVVLTVLAALLGAGGGFVVGFIATVIDRVHTDTQLGCALLQTAESSGYLTKERRGQLVDKVVPALSRAPRPVPAATLYARSPTAGGTASARIRNPAAQARRA